MHKLKYYGIRGVALNSFQSYFINRRQYVKYNGICSRAQNINCGVPQGSILGPLLFLIYMNDLPNCLCNSKVILFADDTILYASSDNIVNQYDLINHDLDNLTDWFRANKLSLNTSKTHYMLICPNREINELNQNTMKIASDDIERKDCCKCLGIMIDDNLTWSKHIDYIHSKLSRSLYAINRSRYLVPPKYLKTLHSTPRLVHPYLSYGIALWGGTCKSYLNKICIRQTKALQHIHRSSYNANTNPLFSESKILKLGDLYELKVGKLMYDAIHNTLPMPLSFLYIQNSTVHSYNTRQRHKPHVRARRSMVATNSLTHKAHGLWSATPQQIKELNTRSKFKRSLKREMLSRYKLHM